MKERALVLGGGGPAGIAWEVGLAAGLAAEGFDIGRADSIIGTSAGSLVGGQLSMGIDAQALAELHKAFAREGAKIPPTEVPPGIDHLLDFTGRLPRGAEPTPSQMLELGALALRAKTIPEAAFVARLAGMFGPDPIWPERFSCCTVNVNDGAFKRWTHADGVAIEHAVAASCSVPGLYPPVTLKGAMWMDGGVRSWTNADCAVGHRRVVIVAVLIERTRALLLPVTERERAAIEAAQGRSELIMPDAPVLAAFGENPMDPSRSLDINDAGFAQGRREAARIKAFWD